jgi:hypothetical protein
LFTIPKNFNETFIDFDVQLEPMDSNLFKPGSSIKYKCKEGTYVYSNRSLTSTCLPDGTWSSVANCEPHPCWYKLPKRPLNGFREVGLVLNSVTGNTNGSHANFSCNSMFELVGRERTHCSSGTWETEVPECRPVGNTCRVKPPMVGANTVMKSLSRVEFKYEIDYKTFEVHTVFKEAAYVCARQGMTFRNSTNVMYKMFDQVRFAYKIVKCKGADMWEDVPACK